MNYRVEESYPFLKDDPNDLKTDFELLTDLLASQVGLLISKVKFQEIKADLLKICELIYHVNPSLRSALTITNEEFNWLCLKLDELKQKKKSRKSIFVLPQGSEPACLAHVLRAQSKIVVRLLFRYQASGQFLPQLLFDFFNILANYFFLLALRLNEIESIEEIEFESRNYC